MFGRGESWKLGDSGGRDEKDYERENEGEPLDHGRKYLSAIAERVAHSA